jgi:hypothetical protein
LLSSPQKLSMPSGDAGTASAPDKFNARRSNSMRGIDQQYPREASISQEHPSKRSRSHATDHHHTAASGQYGIIYDNESADFVAGYNPYHKGMYSQGRRFTCEDPPGFAYPYMDSMILPNDEEYPQAYKRGSHRSSGGGSGVLPASSKMLDDAYESQSRGGSRGGVIPSELDCRPPAHPHLQYDCNAYDMSQQYSAAYSMAYGHQRRISRGSAMGLRGTGKVYSSWPAPFTVLLLSES